MGNMFLLAQHYAGCESVEKLIGDVLLVSESLHRKHSACEWGKSWLFEDLGSKHVLVITVMTS